MEKACFEQASSYNIRYDEFYRVLRNFKKITGNMFITIKEIINKMVGAIQVFYISFAACVTSEAHNQKKGVW